MTNLSDKYQDSTQEHEQSNAAAKAAEQSADTATPSALPPYMVSPGTLPVAVAPPEQPEQEEDKEAQEAAAAFATLGEAFAATQPVEEPGPAISVAPDGTAMLRDEVEEKKEEAWHTAASPKTSATPKTPKQKDTSPPYIKESAYPSFGQSHPLLSVEQAMPPSLLSRLYAVPAAVPFIFLTLMLLIQVFLSLPARELWVGAEVRIAALFQSMFSGDGVLLTLNGEVYPYLPPLYFWFLYGLHLLIGSQGPALFFLAAGISALLYLWAALALGRFVGRVDGYTNLAAGIILLSTACILGMTQSAGLSLMFAALTLAACIVLHRAFVSSKNAPIAMLLAFTLAAAATLVNGPLGLLMPLCAITLFALWRGSKDQLQGIVMTLAALAFGLLPALAGLPLLQFFGLLPESQSLPLAWALALLALPALLLLAVAILGPHLRAVAGAALLLMVGAFALSGGSPYFHWPLRYTLLLCLLAVPLFLQATPQRLFRRDFFIGLAAGLLLAGAWLGAVYWLHGDLDFIIHTLLKGQLLERSLDGIGSANPAGWHFYLLCLPLLMLPWTILLFFLPWGRLFSKNVRDGLAASRTPAGEGLAFLWSLVISALLLLSLLGDKNPHHLLPALPALAILAARALMGIEGRRAVFFRYALAALFCIGGLAALFGTLMLFGALPKPDFVNIPWTLPTSGGFFAVSIILLLSGAILWLVLGSSRPEGVLLVVALTATLVGYSIGNLSAPALDPVLSPKQQALMLRAYLDKGYTVASYNVAPGTYNYYTGHDIPVLKDVEAARSFAEKGHSALVMPLTDAEGWSGRPECLEEAHRQWLGAQVYVVLACPAIEGLAPAQAPFGESFDIMGDIVEKTKDVLRGFGLLAPEAPQAVPAPQPVAPIVEDMPAVEPAPAPAVQEPAPEMPSLEATPAPEETLLLQELPGAHEYPAPDEEAEADAEQPEELSPELYPEKDTDLAT